MTELLFRVHIVVKSLAEYVKEQYLYAYHKCSTIIRLMICLLVDAVAVLGMCFFVVLEAEVAPSIPGLSCSYSGH